MASNPTVRPVELPTAAMMHRRTTGSLVAVLLGLIAALLLLVATFMFLVHPEPTKFEQRTGLAPNFAWSTYGRADNLLRRPNSVAIGADGRIYVADTGNSRIVVLTSSGGFIEAFDTARTDGTKFRQPTALDVSADGRIYVVDVGIGALFILSADGEPLRTIIPDVERPVGVEVGPNSAGQESLYVTTRSGILQATLEGTLVGSYVRWGSGLGMVDNPTAIAIGYTDSGSGTGQGGVTAYVVDTLNYRVQAIDSLDTTPTVRWAYGTPLPKGAPLRYQGDDRKFGLPVDIAIDPRGTLYVLDGLSSTVVMLDAQTGSYRGEFAESGSGDGFLNMPAGIDYSEGFLYVADKYGDRVSVFSDPERVVAPEEIDKPFNWMPWVVALAVLALAEVATFVYLLTMRPPRFVLDATAIEALAERGLGDAVAAALGTVIVAGDTEIIARELLPRVAVDVVRFDAAELAELEAEHPLADPYGLAAILVTDGQRGKVVLLTGDSETAEVAQGANLTVLNIESFVETLAQGDIPTSDGLQ